MVIAFSFADNVCVNYSVKIRDKTVCFCEVVKDCVNIFFCDRKTNVLLFVLRSLFCGPQ